MGGPWKRKDSPTKIVSYRTQTHKSSPTETWTGLSPISVLLRTEVVVLKRTAVKSKTGNKFIPTVSH